MNLLYDSDFVIVTAKNEELPLQLLTAIAETVRCTKIKVANYKCCDGHISTAILDANNAKGVALGIYLILAGSGIDIALNGKRYFDPNVAVRDLL